MTLDEVPKMAAEGDPTAQEAYGWMCSCLVGTCCVLLGMLWIPRV